MQGIKPGVVFGGYNEQNVVTDGLKESGQIQNVPSGYSRGNPVYQPCDPVTIQNQKAWIELQKHAEKERIDTEAVCERKARTLDLQVKNENRKTEVWLAFDGSPVYCSEMLAAGDFNKKFTNVSHCVPKVYVPDRYKTSDKVRRILSLDFFNETTREDGCLYLDITNPDEVIYLKKLRAGGIKFLSGRRKQAEHAMKFVEGLEASAKVIAIPRERGWNIVLEENRVDLGYYLEYQLRWEAVAKLCF